MIPHRFNAKLAVLAIIGFILYYGSAQYAYYQKNESMQPELKTPVVTKDQALQAAITYFKLQHPSLISSESNVLYESRKTLSGYLQKNNLAKAYKAEYKEQFPLDFWQVQIWDQLADRRYTADVGMVKATVIGWQITDLSPTAAEAKSDNAAKIKAAEIARNYLVKQGYVLQSYEEKAVKLDDEDNYIIDFELNKAIIGQTKQTLSIGVSADMVVAFHIDFNIPEAESTWISDQEAYGQYMSLVSLGGMIIFAITAIVISIRRRKLISFSRGWILAGLYMAISAVNTFNTLPSMMTDLGEKNEQAYIVINLIFTIGVNFLMAFAIYLMLVSGLYMWKQRGWNPWPSGKESKFATDVFYGMGRGYLICIFVVGVQQVLFLIAGQTFHSFAINDPSQSELNLAWPLLFPTLTWMAAISEEVIFRHFGIIIFQRLLRFRVLAVLVPSVIWALGHTSYSLYPSYTRLFEVAVLGFIFSYTFLRYGLITAIFTHAIMDSLLMGLSLIFTAENQAYTYIGLFYIVFPAILAYLIRFSAKKRTYHEDELNPSIV